MGVISLDEKFLFDNFINLFDKSKIKCVYVGFDKFFKRYNYKVTVLFEGKQYTLNYYKSGEIGISHFEIIDYLMSNAIRMSKISNVESYINELSLGFNGNRNSYEYNLAMFKNFHKDFLNSVRLFGEFKILNYKKCMEYIHSGYNYSKFDKFISNYRKTLVSPSNANLLVKCNHCNIEFSTSKHNSEIFCVNCVTEFRR